MRLRQSACSWDTICTPCTYSQLLAFQQTLIDSLVFRLAIALIANLPVYIAVLSAKEVATLSVNEPLARSKLVGFTHYAELRARIAETALIPDKKAATSRFRAQLACRALAQDELQVLRVAQETIVRERLVNGSTGPLCHFHEGQTRKIR